MKRILTRYPEQARTRKGFVLVGLLFMVFGLIMWWVGVIFMAAFGLIAGTLLLVPSLVLGRSAHERYVKVVSWVAVGW